MKHTKETFKKIFPVIREFRGLEINLPSSTPPQAALENLPAVPDELPVLAADFPAHSQVPLMDGLGGWSRKMFYPSRKNIRSTCKQSPFNWKTCRLIGMLFQPDRKGFRFDWKHFQLIPKHLRPNRKFLRCNRKNNHQHNKNSYLPCRY